MCIVPSIYYYTFTVQHTWLGFNKSINPKNSKCRAGHFVQNPAIVKQSTLLECEKQQAKDYAVSQSSNNIQDNDHAGGMANAAAWTINVE